MAFSFKEEVKAGVSKTMTASTSRMRQVETDRGQKVATTRAEGENISPSPQSFSEGCSLSVCE